MLNTNSGRVFRICTTPQPDDLDLAAFQALTYVEVSTVGSLGETGNQQNILSYDSWNTHVIQKQKGMTNAGDPELECAADASDAGQAAMKAAAATKFYYAFEIEGDDKLTVGGTNGKRYNRGLVAGPRKPNGRNEDFDLIIFDLGLVQEEIEVLPT